MIIKPQQKENTISTITIFLVIFFFFPFGGVLLSFYYAAKSRRISSLWVFALILALYVSFINTSKVIDSDPDLPWYTNQYKMAGDMGYVEYIFSFGMNGKGRELFFPTFNYIVYFLVGDNVNLYRFIHSLLCYILSFTAIIRLSIFMKLNNKYAIFSIVWFTCMPWIFTYSQTILRQFLAGSFLMVILVEHFFYRKRMLTLSLCMVLTHTSTILFLPFLYLPFFKRALTIKSSLFYFVGFVFLALVQKFSQYAMSKLGFIGDNALTYALERASSDTTFELPPLSLMKIIFLILLIYLTLITYYNQKLRKNVLSYIPERHIPLISTFALFCAFIIANLRQAELSNRLFSYAAMLSSFSILYIARMIKVSTPLLQFYFWIMQLILIIYFMNSIYNYEIPFGIMLFPIQYLI